jgi:hypothetical protein
MKVVSVRSAAIRMGILIVFVCALDATVVFFAQKPLFWAGTIPALIPLLTPAVIFSFGITGKSEN